MFFDHGRIDVVYSLLLFVAFGGILFQTSNSVAPPSQIEYVQTDIPAGGSSFILLTNGVPTGSVTLELVLKDGAVLSGSGQLLLQDGTAFFDLSYITNSVGLKKSSFLEIRHNGEKILLSTRGIKPIRSAVQMAVSEEYRNVRVFSEPHHSEFRHDQGLFFGVHEYRDELMYFFDNLEIEFEQMRMQNPHESQPSDRLAWEEIKSVFRSLRKND